MLVDISVGSDHLRRHDAVMASLLQESEVLTHPFVIGENVCCRFPRRTKTLSLMSGLPSTPLLGQAELLAFIDRHALAGRGAGLWTATCWRRRW